MLVKNIHPIILSTAAILLFRAATEMILGPITFGIYFGIPSLLYADKKLTLGSVRRNGIEPTLNSRLYFGRMTTRIVQGLWIFVNCGACVFFSLFTILHKT